MVIGCISGYKTDASVAVQWVSQQEIWHRITVTRPPCISIRHTICHSTCQSRNQRQTQRGPQSHALTSTGDQFFLIHAQKILSTRIMKLIKCVNFVVIKIFIKSSCAWVLYATIHKNLWSSPIYIKYYVL